MQSKHWKSVSSSVRGREARYRASSHLRFLNELPAAQTALAATHLEESPPGGAGNFAAEARSAHGPQSRIPRPPAEHSFGCRRAHTRAAAGLGRRCDFFSVFFLVVVCPSSRGTGIVPDLSISRKFPKAIPRRESGQGRSPRRRRVPLEGGSIT